MNFRLPLFAGALASLMPVPQGAFAQDDTIVLEPIIVTARRREEPLQDAPVAVTAITDLSTPTAATLEDATSRAPNLLFNPQGGPIAIRGISSLGISGGVDRQPAVGVFLDDVYISRPLGYPAQVDDLARVEVVRGSQATLYGKNTIGGAVNLVTKSPDGSTGGEAVAGAGSDGAQHYRLSYQAPVNDNFALRTTLGWADADGYIQNAGKTVSDKDMFTGQSVLAGTFANGTRLRFALDYSRDESDGGLWYAPVADALAFRSNHDFAPENEVETGGATLRLDHDFGGVALTSITAYRGHDFKQWLDGDFSAVASIGQGQVERQRQFSQELRLERQLDSFRWTAGAFFMHEDFEGTQFFEYATVPRDLWSRDVFDQTTDTYALFGEAGWFVTPTFELSLGGRLSHERKSTSTEISSPSGTFVFGMPGRAEEDASFTNVSPELTASWHPSERSLVWGKLSRGYKSGGISPYIEADGSANAYDPETSTTAEIGFRHASADGRHTFTATAFHTDWNDQQAVIYMTPSTRVYRNAAEAISQGIELEGMTLLTDALRLTGGYGYTDAGFDDFVDAVAGNDYTGNDQPYAPKHSLSLGLDWTTELRDLTLEAGAQYTYRSDYAFTYNNRYRQDDTHILDAHVSLASDVWTATLYGKNLTDERYLRNYFDNGGTDVGVAAAGRTFGLELRARF